MRTVPLVDSIEVWPLVHRIPDGEAYGSSRGVTRTRASTLVKLTTSDGVVGWGESFGAPSVILAHLAEYSKQVLGTPVDRTEAHILDSLARGYIATTGGAHIMAMSAIDVALWDAWARTLDVNVASLLGGRQRSTARAYASTGYFRESGGIAAFERDIHLAVEHGFSAVKVKIGRGIDMDVDRVTKAREVLGPDRELMVDYNANYPVRFARTSMERIRHLDLTWVEEPLPPDDLDGYAELRTLGIPLAAGEAHYTRFGFREMISRRTVDVVQPDPIIGGGFTESRLVAQMAAAWNVTVSPHCWGGGLSQAIGLQLLAVMPNYPLSDSAPLAHYLESDRSENPLRTEMLAEPIKITAGEVAIPSGPGLGVQVDEEAMRPYLINGTPHLFRI